MTKLSPLKLLQRVFSSPKCIAKSLSLQDVVNSLNAKVISLSPFINVDPINFMINTLLVLVW